MTSASPVPASELGTESLNVLSTPSTIWLSPLVILAGMEKGRGPPVTGKEPMRFHHLKWSPPGNHLSGLRAVTTRKEGQLLGCA